MNESHAKFLAETQASQGLVAYLNKGYRELLQEVDKRDQPPEALRDQAWSPVWHYELEALVFGECRIIWTDGIDVAAAWYYPTVHEAHLALFLFHLGGYQGEPQSWIRAFPPFHRRRPHGDPEREHIAR